MDAQAMLGDPVGVYRVENKHGGSWVGTFRVRAGRIYCGIKGSDAIRAA